MQTICRMPEFGHFLLCSLAEANPEGWKMVAGGRSGQRGDDHRKAVSESDAPRGVPERNPTCNSLAPRRGAGHLSPSRPETHFGACYLAGTAGHARRFNNKQKKESYV
jgi:hypothetical protein